MICITSRIGLTNAWKRSFRPARMPSGMPIRSDSATAASVRPSVSMLSSHRPSAPRLAKPVTARSATLQPPARNPMTPAAPMTPIQPIPWSTPSTIATSASMTWRIGSMTYEEQRVRGPALVDRVAQAVEPLEDPRLLVVGQRRRPAEREVEDDRGDDEEQRREPPLLAGVEPAGGRRQADRGHGVVSSPSGPAIAFRIWTRSTTPTRAPSSTTRIGLSRRDRGVDDGPDDGGRGERRARSGRPPASAAGRSSAA